MSELRILLKGKTPVSFLQELCTKNKWTPSYDVIANEGPIHEPVFIMRAQAGEFQGTGKGPSKIKAKHNAAEKLLCSMFNLKHDPTYSEEEHVEAHAINGDALQNDASTRLYDGDMQGNPIGELQEYTQKNLLKPPTYDFIGEDGPPHAREFVCTVRLAKLQETAVGKSKKIAKRAAASKLLQSLRHHQNDNSSSAIIDEEEDEVSMPVSHHTRDTKVTRNLQALTAEGAKLAGEFFENLRLTSKAPGSGRGSQYLQSANLSSSCENSIKALEDMAKTSKFEVTYLDMKQKSFSGHFLCMAQIGVTPIAVCVGMGSSPEDARKNAAYNALLYLRVMTADN